MSLRQDVLRSNAGDRAHDDDEDEWVAVVGALLVSAAGR
jgi:hypothetical protein